ncbi:MAG TPA: class D sortase [Gemmatimonadaceae bacterium]|nr:class D sortase [Gemmatimonadaceae bacterium]
MRRALALLLTLGGAGLLSYVGATYTRGFLARERARAAWEEHQARRAVREANGFVVARYARPTVERAPVARLLIPRIVLDEIVVEGVDDESLNAGPGHLPGSVLPGERGNSVISAHRDRHFSRLDAIAVGDTIETQIGQHKTTWQVVSKRVVSASARVLWEKDSPTLTLTTCWPVRFLGPAPDRLLVTAVPVPSTARS